MTTGTDVVDQEALRRQMQDQMKAAIGSGSSSKIKLTKSKKFKLPDGVESDGPLSLVILAFAPYNTYYDRPYSDAPDKKTPPACFALAPVKPAQLVPSDRSPVKQDEGKGCGQCWANKFKTAPNGVGKACRNHYRIMGVEANDDAQATIYMIEAGPTSVVNWETYFANLQLKGKLPIDVVTDIWFDPKRDYQTLVFGNEKPNPFAATHLGRYAEAQAKVLVEPDVSTYAPPAPTGRPK